MSELHAGATAVFFVVVLVMLGYIFGSRRAWAQAGEKLERGIARIIERVAARRSQDIESLARLRAWLEQETDGVTVEQALLLTDVCAQLGYNEAETQHVVGVAYLLAVDVPIGNAAEEEM